MPDLSMLLQQHVEQLSHAPSGGFAGVRAKARRRTQQRVGFATVAALVIAGVVVTGTGTFSNDKQVPAHPSPTVTVSTTTGPAPAPTPSAKAATLVQTHWRMTSITAFGRTQPVDDDQVYLYIHVPTLGGWLLHEPCQNIAGGASLAQSDTFSTTVKGSGDCAAQPLAKAVAEVFRSPLNDRVQGQHLTLVGDTGAMTFVAEPETVDATPLTSHIWQLTSVQTATANLDLSTFHGTSPDALWLVFGRGSYMAETGCDAVQGEAVTSGHFLDLAGALPVQLGNCSGSAKVHKPPLVTTAYQQVAKEGRVTWTITGTTLQLRGTGTVLTFTDKGPASQLQGTPASASAS
jgi:hypothetical protein